MNFVLTLGGAEDSVFAEDFNTFYSRFDIHDFFSEVNEIKQYFSVKCHNLNIFRDITIIKYKLKHWSTLRRNCDLG